MNTCTFTTFRQSVFFLFIFCGDVNCKHDIARATSGGSQGMSLGRCWQSAWRSQMPFGLETLRTLSLTSQSIRYGRISWLFLSLAIVHNYTVCEAGVCLSVMNHFLLWGVTLIPAYTHRMDLAMGCNTMLLQGGTLQVPGRWAPYRHEISTS